VQIWDEDVGSDDIIGKGLILINEITGNRDQKQEKLKTIKIKLQEKIVGEFTFKVLYIPKVKTKDLKGGKLVISPFTAELLNDDEYFTK